MSCIPEPPSDIWLEHSNFLGVALGSIAYALQGCFVVIFLVTVYYMFQSTRKGNRGAINLTYTFVLFAATTVNVAMNIRWGMLTFIDHRNYPGGPAVYAFVAVPEWNIGNTAFVVSNFLTDGLVIYRCLIIWKGNYLVIAIPSLMFLASTAVSILTVYQSSRPGVTLHSTLTVNFALPYWSLSIFLNIMVTLLISGKLLMMRKRMHKVLGARHTKKYTSAVAMLVESAALYSGTALIFIITYARRSYVQHIVLPILSSVMPAAPLLILLRVASGNGFSRETTKSVGESTKLLFAPRASVVSSQGVSTHLSTEDSTPMSENREN